MTTESSGELDRIRQLYDTTFRPDLRDRSNPWHPRNPVGFHYRQAQERAMVRLLNDLAVDLERLEILDVGCGTGSQLRFLGSLGARAQALHGVDLMPGRIERAREAGPAGLDLRVGSADQLPWPDASFDLVSQFTVFSSILDAGLRGRVAREMVRVLRPGGHVLWYDVRRGNAATLHGFQAPADIALLFPGCPILACSRGVPPGAPGAVPAGLPGSSARNSAHAPPGLAAEELGALRRGTLERLAGCARQPAAPDEAGRTPEGCGPLRFPGAPSAGPCSDPSPWCPCGPA